MVLLVVALVAGSSVVSAAKMPKGSFLTSHVTTVEGLAQQVTDDAIVAARYAKHFRASRNAVVDYFQANLQIGRLRTDYHATVYVVSGLTDIAPTEKVLPKGSYVFVAANGLPLLEASTGDPIADHLPQPLSVIGSGPASATSAAVTAASGEAGLSAVVAPGVSDGVLTKVLAEPPAEIGTAPGGLAAASLATSEPLVDIVASMPSVGPAAGLASIGRILPVAAVIGGIALAGGGGSSQSPGTGPVPSPVPEPASLSVLALGVSALAFRTLKRRR